MINIIFFILDFIMSYIEVVISLLTIILIYFRWPALVVYVSIAFILGIVMMLLS